MYPEQQRYWIALLNLQQGWASDESAVAFIPPRHRIFDEDPGWPLQKALRYLHNNLELIRESWRRLEAGERLDLDLLNHGLEGLRLRLHPWPSPDTMKAAARAKEEVGGRLETLQVTAPGGNLNAGTRYIRATIQRSLYYFAHYVDYRFSDSAYPARSPDRWSVAEDRPGGELVLVPPQQTAAR